MAWGILVPWPVIEPKPLALGEWSLNPWNAWEAPLMQLLKCRSPSHELRASWPLSPALPQSGCYIELLPPFEGSSVQFSRSVMSDSLQPQFKGRAGVKAPVPPKLMSIPCKLPFSVSYGLALRGYSSLSLVSLTAWTYDGGLWAHLFPSLVRPLHADNPHKAWWQWLILLCKCSSSPRARVAWD